MSSAADDWRRQATKELKGADPFEKLTVHTPEVSTLSSSSSCSLFFFFSFFFSFVPFAPLYWSSFFSFFLLNACLHPLLGSLRLLACRSTFQPSAFRLSCSIVCHACRWDCCPLLTLPHPLSFLGSQPQARVRSIRCRQLARRSVSRSVCPPSLVPFLPSWPLRIGSRAGLPPGLSTAVSRQLTAELAAPQPARL